MVRPVDADSGTWALLAQSISMSKVMPARNKWKEGDRRLESVMQYKRNCVRRGLRAYRHGACLATCAPGQQQGQQRSIRRATDFPFGTREKDGHQQYGDHALDGRTRLAQRPGDVFRGVVGRLRMAKSECFHDCREGAVEIASVRIRASQANEFIRASISAWHLRGNEKTS
jgi:hypothetical protein